MTERQAAVFELQGYLRNISRADSDIRSVVPDGIFGEETTESVLSFQRKYGLEETGVVGYEVWTEIKKENDNAVFLFSDPKRIAVISDGDLPLKKGDRGNVIYHLKIMLLYLSQKHSNFDKVEVNNIFDEETQKAVKQWQRIIRAEENGQVDKMTWNLLSEYYLLESGNKETA